MTNQPTAANPEPDFTDALMQEVWPRIHALKPNGVRALPAATLILLDRSGPSPKVLLGRRNPNDRFMPGKFVFPGGRVDDGDRKMRAGSALEPAVEQKLRLASSKTLARPLALAGIRETYEETGLVIGQPGCLDCDAPQGWGEFTAHGQLPALSHIHFVARAITPPRLPRRYDTIFLAADAQTISHRAEGAVGPDKELVELVWTPITQTRDLELPMITRVVLQELEWRMARQMSPALPVPCYRVVYPKGWQRSQV